VFRLPWAAAGSRGTLLPTLLLLGVRALGAQGAVSGQVTILERPGMQSPDLANAVVYLQTASRPARAPDAATLPIVMESKQFVPRVRVIGVGSTVSFPNQDPFRHNVFSKTGPREFDLGLYGRGESRGVTLTQPGVFPVFCNIHARMTAFIVTVATHYFTQAGADGRFIISDVPAGRYTLRVWHERGGAQSRQLEVTEAGAPAVSVQLDARGYRSIQHRNKFGQEYTSAGRDRY
jgi:plastocyanin